MNIGWNDIFTAVGLALVIEGLPYFLWAEKMPKVLRLLSEKPPKALRMIGMLAMLAGLLTVYIVRS